MKDTQPGENPGSERRAFGAALWEEFPVGALPSGLVFLSAALLRFFDNMAAGHMPCRCRLPRSRCFSGRPASPAPLSAGTAVGPRRCAPAFLRRLFGFLLGGSPGACYHVSLLQYARRNGLYTVSLSLLVAARATVYGGAGMAGWWVGLSCSAPDGHRRGFVRRIPASPAGQSLFSLPFAARTAQRTG